MEVSDLRRLKTLEADNARLKKLLAESMLENEVSREAIDGTHERELAALSAAARSQPHPIRARIVALAQRHRRYGAAMIYLKLRQGGELVNHKRVERLYALEKLLVKRRRRKKIPLAERQPLIRPGSADEVWSMDFVVDRIASGRTIKRLVVVDDATHESVALVAEHSMGGNQMVRASIRSAPCVDDPP
jgi:putative transposase